MRRVIVIEWRGGIFREMATLDNPKNSDIVFEKVDSGVTEYAERYDIPIEKIEVNIFIKHLKDKGHGNSN